MVFLTHCYKMTQIVEILTVFLVHFNQDYLLIT